jgi:hypothetical protein
LIRYRVWRWDRRHAGGASRRNLTYRRRRKSVNDRLPVNLDGMSGRSPPVYSWVLIAKSSPPPDLPPASLRQITIAHRLTSRQFARRTWFITAAAQHTDGAAPLQ